jgi:DNA-directed RNA polymerase
MTTSAALTVTETILRPDRHDFSDLKAAHTIKLLTDLFGADLAAAQLQVEHDAYTLGEERFQKGLNRALEREEYADTAIAKPLLTTLVPRFVRRYNDWIEEQVTKVRRKHTNLDIFKALSPEVAAVIAIKRTLGVLASGGDSVTVTRLATAIGRSIEDEMRYGRIRDEEAKVFKDKHQTQMDRRNGYLYKREYMKRVEIGMLADAALSTTWAPWPTSKVPEKGGDDHYKIGLKLMEIIIESSELIVVERAFAGIKSKDSNVVSLHPAWAEKLINRAFSLAEMSPMFQPCVVPPKQWTSTSGGGYWAAGRRPTALIRTPSKKARLRYKDVHMPEVYKAVNLAQNSAWRINPEVLKVANAVAEWSKVPMADYPDIEKGELPDKPDNLNECPIALKAWKKKAAVVYRGETARVSRRLKLEYDLGQANKFAGFEAIWFPYNMDWRGRVYAIPTFNPQGSDMVKGLLTAAEGAPIGPEGRKWLAIHGANTAGADKIPLADRVKWVEDNTPMILACAKAPLDNREWMSMDAPFCFLAFCFEWAGVMAEGDSWVSSLPIAFDGSCSGIQHFSAMLRDERGGAAVNLLPSDKPQDIYQLVALEVNRLMRIDALEGTEDKVELVVDTKTGDMVEMRTLGTKALAAGWMVFGVTRKETKRAVMTLPYGSKEYGFADQILEDTVRPAIDRGEGTMFTHGSQYARYLAKHIWNSMGVTVEAAVSAMSWLQAAAKLMAQQVIDKKTKEVLKPTMPIQWVTPDGFPVFQEYCKMELKRVDLMFLGTHRMEATVGVRPTDILDARKQEAGVSPNFVHSQDGCHLRKTVVKANEAYGIGFFAIIHDSFGTIPAQAGGMFRAVREAMVETYEHNDVLADFRDQFADQLHESQLEKLPALPAKGTLDLSKILQSDFAFA